MAGRQLTRTLKYLKFSNGDEMPMIGLGTSGIPADQAYDIVRSAIKIGYRHFDCAPIYKNEIEVGKAINDAISAGEVSREELWITSKLWNSGHRYNDVEPACEQSLKAMGLDYFDLYLIHWPVAVERDIEWAHNEEEYLAEDEAPLEDTWTGMEDCLAEGTAKHIGVSNFNIAKLELIMEDCTDRPEVNQCEWHPYLPQQSLHDFCKTNKIKMTAYAPLGSPGRSGEYRKPNDPELLGEPAITAIAEKHGITEAQVCLAYGLTRKMAVIPRSTNLERLKENFDAADLKLDREDLRSLIILPKFRYFKGEEHTSHGSPYKLTDIWEY